MIETQTSIKIAPDPFWIECVDLADQDFVLALAYRALEHESTLCHSNTARQQVAFLLDRLQGLDCR